MLIGGGTTSGLRAISLFYVLGYRQFELFGFDSCNDGELLRVNGDGLKDGDKLIEVKIDLMARPLIAICQWLCRPSTSKLITIICPMPRLMDMGAG